MLRVAIVDANARASRAFATISASIVAHWLQWECQQRSVEIAIPSAADIILLVYAGAIGYGAACRAALRRHGIEPNASKRDGKPYIVTGGAIDTLPLLALSFADAVAVGEGYGLVRQLCDMIRRNATIDDIRAWLVAYPHAIERCQIERCERDDDRPWLLSVAPPVLASPDPVVDWAMPPIRSDDKVVRVLGSKGCHYKCAFCATSYRQTYRMNPERSQVLARLRGLKRQGERVQLISNDPANLPYYKDIGVRLDSQSYTVHEMTDAETRAALRRDKVGIARFGVEGLSERIRRAFGKPIATDALVAIIDELHRSGVNTHMFMIVGAPYETEADWAEFRDLYSRLSRVIATGICRVKFTTFLPTPPAPLGRFMGSNASNEQLNAFAQWSSRNCASRHMFWLKGRGEAQHAKDAAEVLGISTNLALQLCRDNAVLCQSLEEYRRMPHEMIRWPISAEIRYKVGEVYRGRMAVDGTTTTTT